MGNKCCGGRKKPIEKENPDSEWTTKYTSKGYSEQPKPEKTGFCPYCTAQMQIPTNLKYLECCKCKQKSMQDGCTATLYKLPTSHCLRLSK